MFRPSRTLPSQFLRQAVRPRPVDLPEPYLNAFRCIRQNTTSTSASDAVTTAAPQSQSKWARRLLYIGIFGGLGLYTGKAVMNTVSAPPAPGTAADARDMKAIQETVNLLPIVRELRNNSDYVEWEAYSNLMEEEKVHRLTSGPLRGSRGLATQRIFWNEKEKEIVNVVYFGHGMEGWLSIVHGGALATVMDETLGQVALRSFPARTGVTANLNLNYRAPVFSGDFYTVHARLDRDRSTDRKAYVNGEVRNSKGKLCVEANALFVVPKKLALREIV
ncbi:hypothetical protein VTN77DRAFT_5491 [Rasamsonia byssochlamydoides]|uniref:uncharacterized protein n=1 Tax=Rasamsonia byssochlamydoides TaxID=89139 RepID=UPI003742ADCA